MKVSTLHVTRMKVEKWNKIKIRIVGLQPDAVPEGRRSNVFSAMEKQLQKRKSIC